jgi:FtsH-binding integral membrane protein
MTLLNTFFFKSRFFSLLKAYFGVLLFTLYLLYDFDRLESLEAQGETSWSAAIDIAVNLYLDIINLFLDLLQILAE